MAVNATGMLNKMKPQRQPSTPPAHTAIAAMKMGARLLRICETVFMIADIRARMPMGELAASSGGWAEEDAGRARDEPGPAVAHMERVADLRHEELHRVQRQLVEGDQKPEDE